MSKYHYYIIKIQPVIQDWEIFRKGVNAAGFQLTNLNQQTTSPSFLSLQTHYRNFVQFPIPDFFLRAIGKTDSFILQGDTLCFLIEILLPGKSNIRVFSKRYPRSKMKILGERVLSNLIQQYAYLQSMVLLSPEDYMVVGETIDHDFMVNINLRRWSLAEDELIEITVLSGPQREEILIKINPEGVLTLDMSILAPEKQLSYTHWLQEHLGFILETHQGNIPVQSAERSTVSGISPV